MEQLLLGAAIAWAGAGIGYAIFRYRGVIADKANAVKAHGFPRLLENAYDVDAALSNVVRRPFDAFARVVMTNILDRGVDRMFTAGGSLLRATAARFGSRVQDGDVGKYAWMITLGGIAVLAALTLS